MIFDEGHRRPQRDELDDPWPLKAMMGLALWPYYLLLTAARVLPLSLGGMDKPTHFPALRLLVLCWPLTLLQAGLGLVFSPLLYWDYTRRYLESIGERGKGLRHAPEDGVHHGVATWLFTRYIEQPLFKPDTLQPGQQNFTPFLPSISVKARRSINQPTNLCSSHRRADAAGCGGGGWWRGEGEDTAIPANAAAVPQGRPTGHHAGTRLIKSMLVAHTPPKKC